MKIITIISDAVAQLETTDSPPVTPRFYYGEEAYANLISDNEFFPAVYLDVPINFEFTLHDSGYLEKTYPLEFYFLDLATIDATEEQHNAIVDEMSNLAEKFIQILSNDSRVRYIDSISGNSFKNIFDVNASGVYLKIMITPFDEKSIC